jgi:hypothetical protein
MSGESPAHDEDLGAKFEAIMKYGVVLSAVFIGAWVGTGADGVCTSISAAAMFVALAGAASSPGSR